MSELWTPKSDTNFATAKAVKPASKWGNKWRSHGVGWRMETLLPVKSGEVLISGYYPSAEMAEQKAAEWITKYGHANCEYLGPFAVEGERP